MLLIPAMVTSRFRHSAVCSACLKLRSSKLHQLCASTHMGYLIHSSYRYMIFPLACIGIRHIWYELYYIQTISLFGYNMQWALTSMWPLCTPCSLASWTLLRVWPRQCGARSSVRKNKWFQDFWVTATGIEFKQARNANSLLQEARSTKIKF